MALSPRLNWLAQTLMHKLRHASNDDLIPIDGYLWLSFDDFLDDPALYDFTRTDVDAVVRRCQFDGVFLFAAKTWWGMQIVRATRGPADAACQQSDTPTPNVDCSLGSKSAAGSSSQSGTECSSDIWASTTPSKGLAVEGYITIDIRHALNGAAFLGSIRVDRRTTGLMLRAAVADVASIRPHQAHLLNQQKAIDLGGDLERAGIVDNTVLQLVVCEHPLAKFLDMSFEWLSTLTIAPSAVLIGEFVHDGWNSFVPNSDLHIHDGHAGLHDEWTPADSRRRCLTHIRAQADAFKAALDGGGDRAATYCDGMDSAMGKWMNIDLHGFVNAALACTGMKSVESLEDRILLPCSGFQASVFPDHPSWGDVRTFYMAGQSYE